MSERDAETDHLDDDWGNNVERGDLPSLDRFEERSKGELVESDLSCGELAKRCEVRVERD